MKFEKDIWYSFSIIGLTNIPDKGEHYILLHDSGRKMLLKTEYYIKYHIAIGQLIQCRVDKINCTGQVFLEPKHPYYVEGELYDFKPIKIFPDEELIYNATVKDIFENEIDIYLNNINNINTNQLVSLNVIQIKKGIPILSELAQGIRDVTGLTQEKSEIKLFVNAIKRYNSEEYYILSDKNHTKAKIKVNHYQNFGFGIGDEIKCNVIGYQPNNQLIIEPKNPWYKIGNVYSFKKVDIEDYIDLEGTSAKMLIVIDVAGNKCGVQINELVEKQVRLRDKIECKVIGFKKGRPQLEVNPHIKGG